MHGQLPTSALMPGLSCSVSPGTIAIQLSLPLCRPYLLCLSRHGSHSALSQSAVGAAASWMLSGSPPSLFLWQIPCGQQEQSPEIAQCHDEEKEGSKSEYLIASSYPISTFPLPKLQDDLPLVFYRRELHSTSGRGLPILYLACSMLKRV